MAKGKIVNCSSLKRKCTRGICREYCSWKVQKSDRPELVSDHRYSWQTRRAYPEKRKIVKMPHFLAFWDNTRKRPNRLDSPWRVKLPENQLPLSSWESKCFSSSRTCVPRCGGICPEKMYRKWESCFWYQIERKCYSRLVKNFVLHHQFKGVLEGEASLLMTSLALSMESVVHYCFQDKFKRLSTPGPTTSNVTYKLLY